MAEIDNARWSIEGLSGGENTIITDDTGHGSIYFVQPLLYNDELIPGAPHEPHPAFIIGGEEQDKIYIGKYEAVVYNDRAYSLPGLDPSIRMSLATAITNCRMKGTGHHVTTNAEWAAIALLCMQNGFLPRGNNNYGKDYYYPNETGTVSYIDSGGIIRRVATGSGTATWYHNNSKTGIADMNGNAGERIGGMRIKDGEINIIQNNDAALATCDMGDTSAEWKAILQNGDLVQPDTEGTLKYDYVSSRARIAINLTTQANTTRTTNFGDMTVADGVIIPLLMQLLALQPTENGKYASQALWYDNTGIRLPVRGGHGTYNTRTGIYALALTRGITAVDEYYGFRPAYYGAVV